MTVQIIHASIKKFEVSTVFFLINFHELETSKAFNCTKRKEKKVLQCLNICHTQEGLYLLGSAHLGQFLSPLLLIFFSRFCPSSIICLGQNVVCVYRTRINKDLFTHLHPYKLIILLPLTSLTGSKHPCNSFIYK